MKTKRAGEQSLSGVAGALDQLITLNPRPFESVTIAISLLSALMMAVSPTLFEQSTNFSVLVHVSVKESLWCLAFSVLGTIHLAAMLYDLYCTKGRTFRRVIMFLKMFWSGFIMFACLAAPPFGTADVLYIIYAMCSVAAYLQLYFGRAS